MRVAVYRLRRKLEDDPAHPRLLHTVAGVGVMLKPPPEAPEAPEAEAQAPGGAWATPHAP